MKKRIVSWIYKLPIIRGLTKNSEKLQRDMVKLSKEVDKNYKKISADFIETKSYGKENRKLINTLDAEKGKIKADIWDLRVAIQDLKKASLEEKKQMEDKLLQLSNENKKLRAQLKREIDYRYYKGLLPLQYEENLKEWYFKKTGEKLNLDNPQTYNEKMQWLKLYDSTAEKTRLADKYLVRDYVKEKIGEQYLTPLIGVWERAEDIDFDKLPNQFALKVNHGAGWNIIVHDKKKLDIKAAKDRLNDWLNTNFAFCCGLELHYATINPLIIAEEYIENKNGQIDDFKVFCFNGKAKYIMYLTDRQNGLKMAFYDLDWNLQPFVYDYQRAEEPIEKPDNLDEMITLAEKLSQGFVQVRVDFYRLNDGSLRFGEMTFTSLSGACRWDPPEYDKILGDMIDLSECKSKKI